MLLTKEEFDFLTKMNKQAIKRHREMAKKSCFVCVTGKATREVKLSKTINICEECYRKFTAKKKKREGARRGGR